MIGKIFNQRYQIMEKLGTGGTSIVYRGQDLVLNRAVTVKILREEFATNEDFVRRFRHEAQAVASLSHPNIVGVYDVGFEANMYYIVMEYVEGESLKEYIKRKGALTLAESCNIITQILSGVQHAHEHGIVHRDIKPHNILLSRDGRAKVTDFGIAVGMNDVTLTHSTSSRIMGSVHYISPEQVQGQPVTERSDIYACGVVFYEMLTGRLPFVGETPISIAMQHVQGELLLPHQVNPDVPISVSYVVMRAMRKNPDTRYASAAEMTEAVRTAYQSPNLAASGVMPADAKQEEESAEAEALHARLSQMFGSEEKPAVAKPLATGSGDSHKMKINRVVLLVLAAVLVVGIVLLAGYLARVLNVENDRATVPPVVGLTQEEAEAQLTEAKLTAVITLRASESVEAGRVISQSIEGGQEVSIGREIELIVSAGLAQVKVPNVTGTTQNLAELTLGNQGFQVEVKTEYNDEVAKDRVIGQSPVEGTEVAAGSIVSILVSLGKEPVEFVMQDLVGMTLADATAYIETQELVLGNVTMQESIIYSSNMVMSQSIAADSQTQSGTQIDMVVSKGPGPTIKSYSVNYYLEQDYDSEGNPVEIYHNVVIGLNDSRGYQVIFSQSLAGGSLVSYNVQYYNSGDLAVTVDGVVVQATPLN